MKIKSASQLAKFKVNDFLVFVLVEVFFSILRNMNWRCFSSWRTVGLLFLLDLNFAHQSVS